MTDHDAFLRAICADPADDTARLVFADWLADHGDPDRGEFIRIEVELARRDPEDEAAERRRSALYARRDTLLKANQQRWIEPFLPAARDITFRRGFVAELEAAIGDFLRHGAQWLAVTPLTRVRFTSWGGVWNPLTQSLSTNVERLFASPLLSRLEGIVVEGQPLTEADIEVLARHPDLGRLRELVLRRNRLGNAGAIVLAGMPQLRGLEELDLAGNNITDPGARAIAGSPHLAGLKELRIAGGNPIRKKGWAVLEARFGPALVG
jgi:uncharacterized protein (TIGR02996 family)